LWLAERNIESLLYRDGSNAPHRQTVCNTLWAAQRRGLAEIVAELAVEGIEPIVFKGAAFHTQFYGSHAIGQMNDLDLLVSPDVLDASRRCLSRLGYRQAVFDAERTELVPLSSDALRDEGDHYELYPFMLLEPLDLEPEDGENCRYPVVEVNGCLHAVIEIDLHHGVATNIAGDEFFVRATKGADGALAMSPADQLWFTTSRYYTEVATDGKRSLRDFAYLIPLLVSDTVDWSVVLAANERYLLHPSLYYYLSFMNWLGEGKLVPADVLDALSPARGPRRRDWGWQLGVLFDAVEPPPFAQPASRSP
jgi:hypothetical protein